MKDERALEFWEINQYLRQKGNNKNKDTVVIIVIMFNLSIFKFIKFNLLFIHLFIHFFNTETQQSNEHVKKANDFALQTKHMLHIVL